MNDLTVCKTLTMSSREIAELTGKNHKEVLRDVRVMLDGLEIQSAQFCADYKDSRGRRQEEFRLPKDLTLTLVSGYNVKLRKRIIDRWIELEDGPKPQFKIPQTYAEALRLSADLHDQNAKMAEELEENRPKVDFYDKCVDAENSLGVRDVAKILGTGERRLFKLLRDERLFNKENIPYQRYIDMGLFLVKTTIHYFDDRGRQIVNRTPVVTGKGIAYLQRKYFPVGARQLHLIHKNPTPPGTIKIGSTAYKVLNLLKGDPLKVYTESEIMQALNATHGAVGYALAQLRHFGRITAVPSKENERYFLYRIKNEAVAA